MGFVRVWRALAFVVVLASPVLAPTTAGGDTLPPSLQGEVLSAAPFNVPVAGDVQYTATCDQLGGTVTWEASGVAFGPYPGTFTETGRATLGPDRLFGSRALIDVSVRFRITSAAGTVEGTKTLDASVTQPFSRCFLADYGPTIGTTRNVQVDAVTRYEAVIRPATGGSYADTGQANVHGVDLAVNCTGAGCLTQVRHLTETFPLSNGVVAVQPVNTPGQATGGGQVDHPAGTSADSAVTFGFTAWSTGDTFKGTCEVVDHALASRVKCLSVSGYAQAGNTAVFSGAATVDGVGTTYRISVTDNAESGVGADSFEIVTSSGYTASGVLTEGNIQVHS